MRHAATTATRAGAFPGDESLDERGRDVASAVGGVLRAEGAETLCSPARRCVETATAAGLPEPELLPDIAECDFGSWAHRTLAEIDALDRACVTAWMTDPDAAPHGGESLSSFAQRVGAWLDGQARLNGRAIAITHGGVVKAALVRALQAPLAAFWRIDVAPLAVTELHAHDGRWTVTRVNCLAGAGSLRG